MKNNLDLLMKQVRPPPDPVESGPVESWPQIEDTLGLNLPEDYRSYGLNYGSGEFCTTEHELILRVFNPFSKSIHQQINNRLRHYADGYSLDMLQDHSLSLFPVSPGLLPWGEGENRRTFFWYTKGNPEEWPIIIHNPENELRPIGMSFSSFLLESFAGNISGWGGSLTQDWFRLQRGSIQFSPESALSCNQFPSPHQAVINGDVEEVRRLLSEGANPNALDYSDTTPLLRALEQENIQLLKVLLDYGANPNLCNQRGDAPLHEAVIIECNAEAVELLLNAGAEINTRGSEKQTPLHDAVRYDIPAIAQQLLENNADPTLRDADGNTPLDLADHNEALRKLLQSKANG